MRVSYPEAYPDVAPDLDLTSAPNAPRSKDFDIHDDKRELLDALQPTIEENMGMAMVFTLVTTLKEGAEQMIQDRRNKQQAQKEQEAAKAEEEENRKFQGDAVTRESFTAWLAGFKKEMEDNERREQEEKEAEERKKKASAREEKRMTGKELWVKGLAGKTEDYDDDDADGHDALAAAMQEKATINGKA